MAATRVNIRERVGSQDWSGGGDLTAEQAVYRKLRWRLVPYLLLLYVIAWLDRVNISFAALQMNADLGLSAAVYGLGAGIFFAAYALCEVPSNLILARVGARRWIARIMVTWGIISVAMMFVEGKWSFYALRVLLGVAEAGFLPGVLFYLSQWFPSQERARAVSWFLLGIPLSSVIGGPLAGLLLGLDGWHGLRGWQWLFVLEGLPAILLGVTTWFLLPDSPHEARWLKPAERQLIERRIKEETARKQARHGAGLRVALLHPTVWVLCLVTFCCQAGSYGLTLWIPQIVRGISVQSDLMTGMITAIPYAAAAVAMVLVGASSDRTGERFWHVALPSFIGAAGFAASAIVHSPVPSMIALTIAAVGDMSTRGAFWTLPGRFLTGSALAAGIAFINTFGALGGFVGPTMVGYVREKSGSFAGGLLVLAGLLVVAGVGTLVLKRAALLREE
jgi:MFS transporter, ACS family, tartrate transporter